MSVLHICNDYLGSNVYRKLYKELANCEVKQTVFSPLRVHTLEKYNKELNGYNHDYELLFSKCLKPWHTYVFELKSKYLYKDLLSKIDLSTINCIHATTLFSDGALAYKIFQKSKIPYVVNIRSTDVTTFFNYRPDLLYYGRKILMDAKKIVFISHNIKEKLLSNKIFQSIKDEILAKHLIIPNGVDDFWISNAAKGPRINSVSSKWNILYVGTFIKRKNLDKLIQAVQLLVKKGFDVQLTVVGGGSMSKNLSEIINENSSFINFIGPVDNKSELLKVYNEADVFAMPSINETFGLVYIESLLQGLPVIYSQGEGIDGLYSNVIGERVLPNVIEIANGIEKIINNYGTYGFDISLIARNHSWERIANIYKEIYLTQ